METWKSTAALSSSSWCSSPSSSWTPSSSPTRGLDVAAINGMLLYRNSGNGGGGGCSEAEWCICLEIFGDKEEVKVLPECRHCFHSECVDKWFAAQSSFPLSRASLRINSPV